jgi:hypothetical protein
MWSVEKSQDENRWPEKIAGPDLAGVQLPVYFCAYMAVMAGEIGVWSNRPRKRCFDEALGRDAA